jgi:hypothetical protein
MKEAELRAAAICAHCKKKIGEARVPLFYRVTINRHMLDLPALQRQNGLAMMLGGNGRLASVMGPDEEMTENLMNHAHAITICENCSTEQICVAQLAEYALEKELSNSKDEAEG